MFWEEDEDKTIIYQAPDDVLDVNFSIQCKELPIDHAWALSRAIMDSLPWMNDEPIAGIHNIHVAESSNGWERPDDSESETLRPSRRTKLTLRIPKHRLEAVKTLINQTLNVNGYPLTVGKMQQKPIVNSAVIFARYVLSSEEETENAFLRRMSNEIKQLIDENVKKMMCGKTYTIQTPDGKLLARHLMIADLKNESSVKIQQYGLGEARKLGCGLFMPHKGIKSLNASS